MIPLSNGRSPRIDQFYATLRTMKSHHFKDDSYNYSQQQSIQHIRSLGKQILQDFSTHKKMSLGAQAMKMMLRSSQSLVKPQNLYDKYQEKKNHKVNKQMISVRQTVIKQNKNKTPQKIPKNKKYQNISSKIQNKSNTIGLNYLKKAEVDARKLKQQKKQIQVVKPQNTKWKQTYQKNYNSTQIISYQTPTNRIVKRGEQLKAKKAMHIEQIRTQRIQKQKKDHSFKPQMVSKKLSTIQPNFDKRKQQAMINKVSKQKQLIKEAYEFHKFNPQTNLYRQANSKIVNLWKNQKLNKSSQSFFETERQKQKNSQKTSTTQVNLKSVDELQFIFQ